jgi:hypothetical protein
VDPRRSAVLRVLWIDRITAEVEAAFGEAGIPSILLKGPVLESWTRPEARPRTYIDSDVLVPPDALARAQQVLTELGFAQAFRDEEGMPGDVTSTAWIREEDGANLDLHVHLRGVGASPKRLWHELEGRTEPIVIGGRPMRCLAAAPRALHVVLHAAQHGAHFPAPLADLEGALELADPGVWPEAHRLAVELDAVEAYGAGLRLVPAGRAIADRLEIPHDMSVEQVLRLQSGPDLTLRLDELLRERSLRARLRTLWKELTPSVAFMRASSPLARRGPLGLVLAYLWRPVWLLLRLPAALRAVREARGASAQSRDAR